MRHNLPIEFPLLDYALNFLKPSENIENISIFGVQHLSYTTAMMFKYLIKKGFNPKNIYLLGKCYSSNPLAVNILTSMGINISADSFSFNSHEDYDTQFSRYLKNFFAPFFEKCRNKVIILDDGAELLNFLSKSSFNCKMIAIEQTSSGYHKAKKLSLPYPIINVARCNAKLIFESNFIGRMISRKIKKEIETHFLHSENKKVLIIGNGPIGQIIYKFLKSSYSVDIYDSNPEKSNLNTNEFELHLSRYNIIIGCTGSCSIPYNKYKYLKPNTLLISASSSDREFDSIYLRKFLPQYHNCHRSVIHNGINISNSGFPINFDDKFLDSTEFQLTRGLLLLSIIQAINFKGKIDQNFITVENEEELIKKYSELFPECDFKIERKNWELEFV